ncbi:SpaH/EbpB family LPXTG-anchored major pilin [Streptococcus pyogenes]|uniref:SpaH/EbpB family LPXTG-anchored major pilin n=1 Tax=Streptococcus pyogenes TaxID=1314 RepID=UPI0010A1968A|nr:SpaH/EbpB family LPXTG-anchored major pilin [Streptococcus pyogenes]QHB65518.1 SpaH/EbpB family LPXTG-anchored major pilin [Streptococcus pyogenes]QIK43152.1 SpaH/EbpB family LPXTG-anchored major pilin [Streptococcus pyogenes]QIK45721.1 SpaH/EbpB family LPXTG-anchored major pilin [Streptococcus pyogenes]WCE84225.1 SpaH/EbpB family LPXTG-anchored major pilin [Streptococcus pyogenes]WER79746.1 SpaH/EbpB family LPXTG-anchored major pilin [Streptococcus pyogenes]
MKLSKKLLYSAVVLATVVGPTVGSVAKFATGMGAVRADESVLARRTVKVQPETTKVIITKLQADEYNEDVLKSNGITNENGLPLSPEEWSQKLGKNVKPLAGVEFIAYKLDGLESELIANVKSQKTVESVDQVLGDKLENRKQVIGQTQVDGTITWNVTKENYGTYFVIESKKPETVSSAVAVPFEITLPMSESKGNGYLTEVNIYPKNVTSNTPKPGKDVENLGTNHSTANIGQEVSWFMKGTVPANMKDYESYVFTDTLDSRLDYVRVDHVKYGVLTLESGDYEVTEPQEGNRILKVKLTQQGIQKVATQYPNRVMLTDEEIKDIAKNTADRPFLEVKFTTRINKDVVLGKPVPNEIKIEFDNTSDKVSNPKPSTSPSDRPDVQTGGKKFKKVSKGDQAPLVGAEFNLLDASGSEIKWTTELMAANQAGIGEGKFVNPQLNKPIVMKSIDGGVFEIRGLSYKIDNPTAKAEELAKVTTGTTYKLKETKAPAGYVLLDQAIDFTVSQTSYNTTPTSIEIDRKDATPDTINNSKRPSIPNTGGIGTAIFVAIGVAIMAFATKGMKRRTEEN